MIKFIINIIWRILSFVKNYLLFINDYRNFKKDNKNKKQRFSFHWSNRHPCLYDRTSHTGFDRHYVYHTAWAVRKLKEINPKKHIDIASYIYFVAIASAYIPIKYYEYRPADINLTGLTPLQADLLKLPFESNSIISLSCMHVVEHVGLGRYGDKIDYDGDLKAIAQLKRVVAPGGSVLFVVPIGKPKIMFNAHRIYSYGQIIDYFVEFELKEFSLIPDGICEEGMITNATKELADKQIYGCGCFHFVKLSG